MTDEEKAAQQKASDELRAKWSAMPAEEFRSAHTALRDEITALGAKDKLTADEELRFDPAVTEFEIATEIRSAREARSRKVGEVSRSVTDSVPGFDAPNVLRTNDPFQGNIGQLAAGELRDRAMKVVEERGKSLAPRQLDHLDKLLRSSTDTVDGRVIARRLLTSESDAYRSAWMKSVTQDKPIYSAEEANALNEFRAANEGTPSAGGFGVPVLIDPTIILTSGAADAPILAISTVKTITTDAWKGVSSAGVSWSYDAEAAAVSDDTPTLAQPSIPVYMARGFIPYSIEIGQDYPGFAEEMAMLLSQGYIDLVAKQSATGSGSSSPTGIFTALTNATVTPAHVLVKTAGVLGAVDVRAAWAALPERFRSRASWFMSEGIMNQVRAQGNNLALADFTVDLTKDSAPVLTGRPVVTSDYAPAFTGTTGAENFAVVGDFSNFYIIQRAGMSVELVNHLFDTVTGRPTGQRGWFAFARHGFDAANPNAFRLLANS